MIFNGSAQKPSRLSATLNGWRLQTVSVLDRGQSTSRSGRAGLRFNTMSLRTRTGQVVQLLDVSLSAKEKVSRKFARKYHLQQQGST